MIKFAIFFTSICFVILLFTLVNNSKNIIIKIVLSNASTTLISGIIILFGTLYDYPDYIDIAIMYTVLGFAISTVLLFFVTSGKQRI